MSQLPPEPRIVLRIDHPLTTLLAWQARQAGIQTGVYVRLILAYQASRCPNDPHCPDSCEVVHCPCRAFQSVPGAFDAAGAVDRLLRTAYGRRRDSSNG